MMPSPHIEQLTPGLCDVNTTALIDLNDTGQTSIDESCNLGGDKMVRDMQIHAKLQEEDNKFKGDVEKKSPFMNESSGNVTFSSPNEYIELDQIGSIHHPLGLMLDNQGMLLDKMSVGLLHIQPDIKDDTESSSTSSPSTPGLLSPTTNNSITSPDSVFSDNCTQMSLVERSEGLNIADELSTVDTNTLWDMVSEDATSPGYDCSRKSLKSSRNDTPSNATSPSEDVKPTPKFNADAATSSSHFVFKQFGSDVPGILSFGNSVKSETTTSNVMGGVRSSIRVTPVEMKKLEPQNTDLQRQMQTSVQSILDVSANTSAISNKRSKQMPEQSISLSVPTKKLKEPSLGLSFPAKAGPYDMQILVQPEEQHRARYMTEGSRGAVKDGSQQGHPLIQLLGYDKPINLQVFVGTDAGRVKPHGFYQACKVCGKNSTPCEERDIVGTTVIDIILDPNEKMKASIDCVGILKLRNADVEKRIGLPRSKKRSTKARLVFRVNIPKPDGTYQTLQVASSPIACTQPAGMPEICRKSLKECSMMGGEELFVIGKNFTRGTKVLFQQKNKSGSVIWSEEATIDQEYFQQGHLICTIPKYKDVKVASSVEVEFVIQSSGRCSDPQPFTYLPGLQRRQRGWLASHG